MGGLIDSILYSQWWSCLNQARAILPVRSPPTNEAVALMPKDVAVQQRCLVLPIQMVNDASQQRYEQSRGSNSMKRPCQQEVLLRCGAAPLKRLSGLCQAGGQTRANTMDKIPQIYLELALFKIFTATRGFGLLAYCNECTSASRHAACIHSLHIHLQLADGQ